RPEFQTQVGVETDPDAGGAGDVDRRCNGRTGIFGDRLADGGDMQDLRVRDRLAWQILHRHAAGGGSGAVIVELVAFGAVGYEVDAGRRLRITLHARDIDALPPP